LISTLEEHPFELEEDASELVARYLIEDNNEDYVLVDWEASSKVARVKSIFKNLLSNYELFPDIDEIDNVIGKQLMKQKDILNDYFTRLSSGTYCSKEEFYQSLHYADITLTPRYMDYLL
jgi:hypothetical protein